MTDINLKNKNPSSSEAAIKASIAIITYNHERYIAQALDSILMQQADFAFEIVIGEDCSTDRTRDVIRTYQQQHPEKIRLLLPESNLGMHRNLAATVTACRGQYIAYLEGDDYWTSPYKLQKQADFLDAHSDYILCFHPVWRVYEDSSHPPSLLPYQENPVFTLESLMQENFIPTCAVMYRRGVLKDPYPAWLYQLSMGDWPLYILLAQHGKMGYLEENMATYRTHSGGVWSQLNATQAELATIKAKEVVGRRLAPMHRRAMHQYASTLLYHYTSRAIMEEDLPAARNYLIRCIRDCPFNDNIDRRELYKMAVKLFIPGLNWMIKKKLVIASRKRLTSSTDQQGGSERP